MTAEGDGCVFHIHVVPRSRRDEVVGLHVDARRVRLKVPPVAGKAIGAPCKFAARALYISRGDVTILGGCASRHKRVRGKSTAEIQPLPPM